LAAFNPSADIPVYKSKVGTIAPVSDNLAKIPTSTASNDPPLLNAKIL
jgi:hypothetical protein